MGRAELGETKWRDRRRGGEPTSRGGRGPRVGQGGVFNEPWTKCGEPEIPGSVSESPGRFGGRPILVLHKQNVEMG